MRQPVRRAVATCNALVVNAVAPLLAGLVVRLFRQQPACRSAVPADTLARKPCIPFSRCFLSRGLAGRPANLSSFPTITEIPSKPFPPMEELQEHRFADAIYDLPVG